MDNQSTLFALKKLCHRLNCPNWESNTRPKICIWKTADVLFGVSSYDFPIFHKKAIKTRYSSSIDTVNQGNWCLSIKLRLECFVIVA